MAEGRKARVTKKLQALKVEYANLAAKFGRGQLHDYNKAFQQICRSKLVKEMLEDENGYAHITCLPKGELVRVTVEYGNSFCQYPLIVGDFKPL